jgi:ankyrin repeat protein
MKIFNISLVSITIFSMKQREETSETLTSQKRKQLDPILLFTRPIVDLSLRDEKLKSTRPAATTDRLPNSTLMLANNSVLPITSSRPDIFSACRSGDVNTLKTYFSKMPYKLFSKDAEGKSPLIHASMESRLNVVKWLLANGVRERINDVDVLGRTALHYASLVGCSSVISALRRHGAISDVRDDDGRTPV